MPRKKAEAIFKTFELLMYGDVHYITLYYITDLLCKSVPKMTSPLWTLFLIISPIIIIVIISLYFIAYDV
jgi:hypothetical protein